MPSPTAESETTELERAELQAVLGSALFQRSPTLAHLLSYLCEKKFAGESEQIKEYSVALDVFARRDSFDQDTDSIVRVQANRLRKRLTEYYAGEGASHGVQITIPVGQYVPVFEKRPTQIVEKATIANPTQQAVDNTSRRPTRRIAALLVTAAAVAGLVLFVFVARENRNAIRSSSLAHQAQVAPGPMVGLPVGDEIRILAGTTRSYVDRAGKPWSADVYFAGGTAVRSPLHNIWRTQDPTIYRSSREGDFSYHIPLKPGIYELHLYFAETFYGPEDAGGGGEGSRVMTVSVNGQPLLTDFDVIADAGGGRTADMKVFTDITPGGGGNLNLNFSSGKGGRAIVSAIEIVPGTSQHIRPVRILARDVPYYSNDSHWWSPDTYFKGGQLSASEEPAEGTDDPELYETARWGNFSYAIPAAPGKYAVTLYFIERRGDSTNRQRFVGSAADAGTPAEDRTFNVFCNGKAILRNLNVLEEAGDNHPLVRKITGLEPNAQGKLLLEFVPVSGYATVTAIEVVPQ